MCLKLVLLLVSSVVVQGCGTRGSSLVSSSTPPTVVFIGDSITHNWADPQFGDEFAQEPNWINQGVIGENSNQVAARFQSDVLALHPDVVHIMVGTNDVYPGWELCQMSEVPAVFLNKIDTCANIEAMVQAAQAAGIKVILGTIPPWGPGALPESADPTSDRYARIAELNAWLKQYGLANGIVVADYHEVLQAADCEQYIPSLTVDGVHPSTAGYVQMTSIAMQAILDTQPLLAKTLATPRF